MSRLTLFNNNILLAAKKMLPGVCFFRRYSIVWFLFSSAFSSAETGFSQQIIRKSIPDKLVVLTFDDAAKTHYSFVAPLLKQYNFGGTFYVCEFPPDFEDSSKYMSWKEIGALGRMGFEIGNHTRTHKHVNKMDDSGFCAQLKYIEEHCKAQGLSRTNTFAYPGYDNNLAAIKILEENGYTSARAGGSRPYDPEKDNPFLIPSYSTSGKDTAKLIKAFKEAKNGKVVVLTIHGVPDYAHDWVTTPPELFKYYLQYLSVNHYKVIAIQDLSKYIDFNAAAAITPDFSKETKNH